VKNLKTGIMQSRYTHKDGTHFTKEEFIQKLKTDKEFNDEFGNKGIDQISDLIKQLKENPDSRRLLLSAWNASDLPNQVLPPCHYGFQVYTRELTWDERHELAETKYQIDDVDDVLDKEGVPTRAISLMWNQRSVDTFLGLPFNIASYGLLLEIIAKEVNMVPDELIGNLGDVHLYSNHIEQAKEQIGREPYPLPKLLFKDHLKSFDTIIDILRVQDFILDNYQSHPTIKAPLSN
jgi:thymidylate synthase